MTDQGPARDIRDLIAAGQAQAPPKQLNQADKEALAEAGTEFTVNGVQYGDDKEFGPYFEFSIELEGKPATFRLYSNEKRDPFATQLAELSASGPLSGLRLRAYGKAAGQRYIEVGPVGD